MTLTGLITLANAVALGFLVHQLVHVNGVGGRALLYGAFDIWVTNVIAFGLVLGARRRRAATTAVRPRGAA